MHASFELRDVYKPHRPGPVARLELVLAQNARCVIDAMEDTFLAFHMEDGFTHFRMSNMAPLRKALHDYNPSFD
jgi:hypothetical protein